MMVKHRLSGRGAAAICLSLVVLGFVCGAAAAQDAATAEAAFLKNSPRGAWAALHISGEKLASSQLLQNMMMMSGKDPAELGKMAEFTVFALPLDGPIGPGMKFPFCGVIRAGADAQADAEQDLLEAGAEEIQVDGMKAYRMEAGKLRAMTGAQLPPGSENFSFLVAQVDDGSFLLASDEAALRAIHGASGSSAGEAIPGLAEAVGTRAEHAICLAAYVDGGLKTLMPPEEVAGTPPFVQNMKGLGIGLDMGTGLDLQAELLTGSSQDAAVVLQMIQQQLAQARQQLAAGAEANPGMAPVAQQVGPFLEKIAVTAEGSNVQLAFSLTDAEIGQLMMMGMMMMGGMGGGAQAAPPGGGMPPGMGGF